jgi:hypothetical protein
MPIRRPSASGALTSSANSRAHRSNDSHHGYPGNAPRQPVAVPATSPGIAGATATPQQKVVQVLVNRLKNKVIEIPFFPCLAPSFSDHDSISFRQTRVSFLMHSNRTKPLNRLSKPLWNYPMTHWISSHGPSQNCWIAWQRSEMKCCCEMTSS